MSNKFRPKGKISDFLGMSSEEVNKLTTEQLRGIVNKLNDAANKRIKRLEASGLGVISPSYRAREKRAASGGERFFEVPLIAHPVQGEKESDEDFAKRVENVKIANRAAAKRAYSEARTFLTNKTSTTAGTLDYNKKHAELYERILGGKFEDVAYDRRYKNKKVLKKSTTDKLSRFWKAYDRWKAIRNRLDPDSEAGGTNIEDVKYFEEELYKKGKTNLAAFEKQAKANYLKRQKRANDGRDDISAATADGGGTGAIKQVKHKIKGSYTKKTKGAIKTRFESVKVYDD